LKGKIWIPLRHKEEDDDDEEEGGGSD